MDIESERSLIIEELNNVSEEWILKAIKRLLRLDMDDDDVPEEHKQILDEHIKEYESGQAETIEWEEVKKRLFIK